MAKQLAGAVCFVVSDDISSRNEVFTFINNIVSCKCKTAVIAKKEVFNYTCSILSRRLGVFDVSMDYSRSSIDYFKYLINVLVHTITFVFSCDQYAIKYLRKLRIPATIITEDDMQIQSKTFLENLEKSYNLDFVLPYEITKKAISAHMTLLEKMDAIFHTKKRVLSSYESRTGKKLDINNCSSYNEKLCILKFSRNNRKFIPFADKVKAREIIKKMGYDELLNPSYGTFNTKINNALWEKLPESFVIKRSNASGFNIVVQKKSETNLTRLNRTLKIISKVNYGLLKNELVYPYFGKFIIEKYLSEVTDYKFFCFNGEIEFIAITHELAKDNDLNEPYQIIVDINFNELPFSFGYERGNGDVVKPMYFESMLEYVRALCKGFQHVRIDMVCSENAFYFGEYTFFPGSGSDRFNPSHFDNIIGEKLRLS